MQFWKSINKYPFIGVSLAFICGILFQHLTKAGLTYSIIILVFAFFITVLGKLLFKKNSSILLGISIVLSSFSIGAIYFILNENNNADYPFDVPKIRNTWVEGRINHIDIISDKKLSFELEVYKYENELINKKFLCSVWKDTTNKLDSIYNIINVGDSVKLFGNITEAKNMRNPGEFDYRNYLNSIGISGVINCYKPDSILIVQKGNNYFFRIVFSIRRTADKLFSKYHNRETAALLKAILLADRKDINYSIKESFVNTGVIHVLAVSGLHVGYIILIFQLLFGRLPIRLKYLFTILGLLFFVILTEAQPSVFRASTMAITYLLAKLSNRSTNGFNAIAIAAVIILLFNPNEIFSPGFQLSFSAVISILILYPIFKENIDNIIQNKLLNRLLLFVSVSIAAQIGTLPFTFMYFEKFSVISLVANLFVIPLFGVILAIGIVTLIFSIVLPLIAGYFAITNMLLVNFIFLFVSKLSKLSFAYLDIMGFSLFDSLVYYAAILSILTIYFLLNKKRLLLFIIPLLTFGSYQIMCLDDKQLLEDGKLSIVAIDVGQGDSFLIKFPNCKTAIIDAGNRTEYFDNGSRVIEPLLRRLSIDKINYAFISHLDSDHYLGSIHLIQKALVDTVYLPKLNSITHEEFIKFLKHKKITYRYYSEDKLNIGNCTAYFLNDTTNNFYKHFDSNNRSGIIKFVYGKNTFLFTGDAEIEAEELLVNRYSDFLKSDVLKIGHHGSKTSTAQFFLNAVSPKIGLISAGIMNRFKHPSESVLDLLKKASVSVYRTDEEGAIILVSDGSNIKKIDWRNY